MDYVKLSLDSMSGKSYNYEGGSNSEMCILGLFFTDEVGPNGRNTFRDWANTSVDGDTVSGNCTMLENENGYIVLSDEYPVVPNPTKLKMTKKQFVQLCDDWQKKVVKRKPKEVTIKHEHGEFFIETSN